ncbi:hypothetical protein [Alteraurantiacibacter buctensis]|uniref:Uncharacterized protein n=1 Tax=Alteraurantiacibacter buctensis TaxID=1503981 RepID=A0A844YT71_9SPHN|nr:hypothetical protein [Alteraurantiacibacter buctensis]MXO70216.1 hypothetical protein [Alteraurantiacibacter buctensis]
MPYRSGWGPRLGCFGVGLLLLLAPVALYLAWVITPPLPLRPFDASDWRAVSRSDDYSRQEMVGALIWDDTLEGRTRPQVLALLGPDCECACFSDWDLVYWLGPERNWLSLDSEWLVINFDAAGRFQDYALVTD